MPPRAPSRRRAFLAASVASVALVALAPAAQAAPAREGDALATQLGRVLGTVEGLYVDPVDRDRLLAGAIRGAVRELDPHSEYMDAESYAAFRADSEGAFGGVGVEVDLRGEQIRVLAPIEGSPAEAAGIRSGDRVVAVDGEGVDAKGFEDLVKRLRGAPGTKVTLSVLRDGAKEPLHLTITRAIVHVTSVRAQLLAEGVLYVRVKQFQEGTADELVRAVAKVRKESLLERRPFRGVVLDLRGNPGGLVDEATQIADEWLEQGAIYTLRARGSAFETATATAGGLFVGLPTVALLDEWSASASELLAGALQDHKAATVVGRPSFGKGSVQTILDLPAGAGLKLTTARYYTPSGHAIQGDGIHPDVEVRESTATSAFPPYTERDLPGALRGDPSAPKGPAPSPPKEVRTVPAAPADLPYRRQVPTDPRTGDDPLLAVAFTTLLAPHR